MAYFRALWSDKSCTAYTSIFHIVFYILRDCLGWQNQPINQTETIKYATHFRKLMRKMRK